MTEEKITLAALPPYFGTVLKTGSQGPDCALVQTWMNGLQGRWPNLSKLTVDGDYGAKTAQAVTQFQTLAGLAADGQTGHTTWDALYTAWAGQKGAGEVFCGIVVESGARGAVVKSVQQQLEVCAAVYKSINKPESDGHFGSATGAAVSRFQREMGLSIDGQAGKTTWTKLRAAAAAIAAGNPLPSAARYPNTVLKVGSTGDSVRCVQAWLGAVQAAALTVDGQFGDSTRKAVVKFQTVAGLKADGMVGSATWSALRTAFNATL